MAITTTTLSGAVGASDTVIVVASATGITAGVSTTGSGNTLLKIDNEVVIPSAVNGTSISVQRGQYGTRAATHATSAPVIIGGPADYPNFRPTVSAFTTTLPDDFSPIGAPLTGATIAPVGGYIHHYTGTTQLASITPPVSLVSGGAITLIFDGSSSGLTWSAAGGANSIAVAGSVTAAQAVTFFYDPTTTFWYPSTIT